MDFNDARIMDAGQEYLDYKMKQILRSTIKHLATISSGAGKQKKVLILIYHRVLDEPDFMRPGEVDKNEFTWHMELMSRYFNVLSLKEALEKADEDNLPPRAVCITFDDGYADNYFNALPILNKFGLEATFFIANGFLDGGIMWNDCVIEGVRSIQGDILDLREIKLGEFDISTDEKKARVAGSILKTIKHCEPSQRKQYAKYFFSLIPKNAPEIMLTMEQLRMLYKSGMEIGGHTKTHPILATLDKTEASLEIKENKQVLEDILDTQINFFAYPNGKPEIDYLPEHVQIIKKSKYQAALSTEWGVMDKNSDKWQLPRFTPWDSVPEKFMLRIADIYRN